MRNHTCLTLATAALAAAAAVSSLSCTSVECGEGTVEKDGACVAGVGTDNGGCGPGTKLGAAGTCVPSPVVVCDDDTTQPQVDPDTGVVTCIGSGATRTMCETELPCPAPQAMKLTVCGRLYDTQTDQLVAPAVGFTGQPCSATMPATSGPCALEVKFYDALEFSMNPSGAMQILPVKYELDDCGRFVAENLTRPAFGFLGIGTDDRTGGADNHKQTGAATPNAAAAPARNFRAYVTRNATDQAWTTTSGIAGATFSARGVLAAVFRHRGLPVTGVRIRRNQNLIPADDYYFSDTGVTRSTVLPHVANTDATGPNGTALVINVASATNHDGVGAEPTGCRWPESLAAAIPTVVFVQLKDAETSGGVPCP